MSAKMILLGCILFVLVTSVCGTCQDLDRCYAGSISPNVLSDHASLISFMCRDKSQFKSCYKHIEGCKEFHTPWFSGEADVETNLGVVCAQQSVFNEGVKCAATALVKSEEIKPECRQISHDSSFDEIARDCSLSKSLVECSSQTKAGVKCIAKPMDLLRRKGAKVPCSEVYSSLTSGSGINTYSMILISGWIIAFFIKRF